MVVCPRAKQDDLSLWVVLVNGLLNSDFLGGGDAHGLASIFVVVVDFKAWAGAAQGRLGAFIACLALKTSLFETRLFYGLSGIPFALAWLAQSGDLDSAVIKKEA
jgi:hypothetical protein